MTRKSLLSLIICWFAYFTVPVINNIGVFNGVYVMLCATKGVMIHDSKPQITSPHSLHHAHHHTGHEHHASVDQTSQSDQTAEDHEAEGCPCIHFFFDTKLQLETNTALVKVPQPIIHSIQASPTLNFYTVQARGPPTTYSVIHSFTTLT
jgi:hypothetical protein